MALKTFCFERKLKVFPQISLVFPMAINDLYFKNPNYPHVSQGRNQGENLVATSAMVDRICPPWWGYG